MTVSHPGSALRRFLDLPAGDKALLAEAWGRLLAASWRLRLSPNRSLTAALAGFPPVAPATAPAADLSRRLALAIGRAAAHHLWPMTCLPRALALQRMLARRGIPAALRIGVRKESATIAAHAWIEVSGEAIGEPEAIEARFRALLPVGDGSGPGRSG